MGITVGSGTKGLLASCELTLSSGLERHVKEVSSEEVEEVEDHGR